MSTLSRGDRPSLPHHAPKSRQERRTRYPDLSPTPPATIPAAAFWPAWTDRVRWADGPALPLFEGSQGGGAA